MRTAIRTALLGLVMAALVGAPASAGPGRGGPPSQRLDIRAAASSARQGGTLVVVTQVRLPRGSRGEDPTATAVVHFATGDVTVELSGRVRSLRGQRFGGRGWWAPARVWRGVARVPVRADEQVGRVRVDVTVSLGDGSVTVATSGRIRPSRGGSHTPDPSPDPGPCTQGCQEL